MKRLIFIILLSCTVFLFIGAKRIYTKPEEPVFEHDVSMCGGVLPSAIRPGKDGKFIPVIAGVGHHHYRVNSRSDSAQVYFDQGLSFYYGYHFNEALASFKEAARFDPGCTMAYWGQALALGPFFNSYTYKMSGEVPMVLMSLQRTSMGADARENDLVNAMMKRYSSDTTNADRKTLDLKYAGAMHQLIAKYPADNDIKVLYIDAVMLCHKWDFWNTDGTPKTWTPELVTLCESVLKSDPKQPAALHYYIHLTEASRHPESALPYAEALEGLMPGVSHMVHMATHSYQRNGLFVKGVAVNERAMNVFNRADSTLPAMHLSKASLIHFFAVQSYCAMSAGMDSKGMPLYLRAKQKMVAMKPFFNRDPYAQFVYTIPQIARVRLGKWQQILAEPKPDAQWKYAVLLDDFAKGMAHVHNNDIAAATQCLADLKTNLADSLLAIRRMPYNKPQQPARIASDILAGEILYAEGKAGEAIAMLKNAVAEEDGLIYREPQEWFIPARQYLGCYLLKMNKAAEAEAVYRADLVANPGNGWSLLGLYHSLKMQNKLSGASLYKSQYQKAFAESDSMPVNSVY
jgi:tetratricopeptide (TPR) repeat protein